MDVFDQATELERLDRESALVRARSLMDRGGPEWINGVACCRECGDPIPRKRLDALPGVGLCRALPGRTRKQPLNPRTFAPQGALWPACALMSATDVGFLSCGPGIFLVQGRGGARRSLGLPSPARLSQGRDSAAQGLKKRRRGLENTRFFQNDPHEPESIHPHKGTEIVARLRPGNSLVRDKPHFASGTAQGKERAQCRA